jgi:hypothetical protein
MSPKKVKQPPEKLVDTRDELEVMAEAVHDKSEADQERAFNTKKEIRYIARPWSDVKPGFYKDNVYKVAKERLKVQKEKKIEPSKKKNVKKKT